MGGSSMTDPCTPCTKPPLAGVGWRQVGHVSERSNQLVAQCTWKRCLHGSMQRSPTRLPETEAEAEPEATSVAGLQRNSAAALSEGRSILP